PARQGRPERRAAREGPLRAPARPVRAGRAGSRSGGGRRMAMIDAAMMGAVAAEAQAVDAPFGRALLALGEARADVVGLSADLSKYTDIGPFAQAYPNRFFQT